MKGLFQTTSNALQAMLGLSAGQTVSTPGTARNLISRASKSLLALFAGNENELETYGFSVTIGTAAQPNPTPQGTSSSTHQ